MKTQITMHRDRPDFCEGCETNPPTMRLILTNLDGTLLDSAFLCADCLPEGVLYPGKT